MSYFSLRHLIRNRFIRFGFVLSVIAVIAAFYLAKACDGDGRTAFVRWRPYLADLMAGEDIYALHSHPNSPLMALVLYSFTLLPRIETAGLTIDTGALAWLLAKLAMIWLAIRWVFRMASANGPPIPPWAMAVVLCLAVRPIIGDLMHGNVNLWILFVIVGSLWALTHGWNFTAGLGIALAVACKVTPALFIPYFIWKRAWKSLAGCLIGLPLFVIVVPAVCFGPTRAADLLASWADRMIVPYALHGEVTSKHSNQSIPGLVSRLLTESPSFYDYYDEEELDYHNMAEVEPAVSRWIVRILGMGFLLLMAWSCHTPSTAKEGWRWLAEFSVIALGMLLFSERTWKHHAVTLLLPFTTIVYAVAVLPLSRRQRWTLAGVVAVVVVQMASTSTSLWQPFGFRHGAKLAQTYGAYVWAYLLLLGSLVWLLRPTRAVEPPMAILHRRVRLEAPLERPGRLPSAGELEARR